MHIMHHQVKSLNAPHAFALAPQHMHGVHMDISRFRKEKHLSQRDLADMLGCDQSTVQRAETMHKSAKLTTYQDYASALGVQLWELFSEDMTAQDIELLKLFRKIPASKHSELISILKLAQDSPDK